jgi:hypothetical protein
MEVSVVSIQNLECHVQREVLNAVTRRTTRLIKASPSEHSHVTS